MLFNARIISFSNILKHWKLNIAYFLTHLNINYQNTMNQKKIWGGG